MSLFNSKPAADVLVITRTDKETNKTQIIGQTQNPVVADQTARRQVSGSGHFGSTATGYASKNVLADFFDKQTVVDAYDEMQNQGSVQRANPGDL